MAKNAYDAKRYHQKTTRSDRVSLLKKICALNLSEHGDVEKHLRVFDDYFDRVESAGIKMDNDMRICMILQSLPPSFDSVVIALDGRVDDNISIDIVKSKLMDEYLRQMEREGIGSMRLVKSKRREYRECYFCKRPGHLRHVCRKYKAFLKEERNSRAEKGNMKAKVGNSEERHVAFTSVEHVKSRAWLIDSVASAHMTNDRTVFESMKNVTGEWIMLADGKRAAILGEGSAVLCGLDKDELVRIDVKDLKYVPVVKTNVVSVAKLAEKRLKVDFQSEGCRIVDSGGAVVATGRHCVGRYYLRTAQELNKASTGEANVHRQHQWHRRLDHRDWSVGERIVKEGLATGRKVSDCSFRFGCGYAMEGKSARRQLPRVVERRAEQVASDVEGFADDDDEEPPHQDICRLPRQTRDVSPRHMDDYRMNTKVQKDEIARGLYIRIDDLTSRLSQHTKTIEELRATVAELKDLYKETECTTGQSSRSSRPPEYYRF